MQGLLKKMLQGGVVKLRGIEFSNGKKVLLEGIKKERVKTLTEI
jgi:hypothetical protein